MTPRSRKPVLLLSGTNINALTKIDNVEVMDNLPEEDDDCLTETFKDYLEKEVF